jgi:RND family efflux transporter MFP subunit
MKKILLATIVALVLLTGCEDSEVETKKDSPKIVKVLDLMDTKSLKNIFEYPAEIYPLQNVYMAFEVSGKVVEFYKNVGDKIKKGEVIAKLDDTIYKANMESSLANYKKAQLDYHRYQKLYETNSIAKVQVENSKQALDVAKANYQIAKKNYENTNLVAEFDGVLAKKLVDDYARINAKQQILILQDNSKFKVKFFVPESDMIKSNKGITVSNVSSMVDIYIIATADDSTKYKAKLIDISTTAEQVTRTFEVTVVMDNPKDRVLLPGMTAKVKVYLNDDSKNEIFIPLSTVFSDSTKKSFVWVVDKNNIVHKKEIKLGRLESSHTEVVSGLSINEKIVTSGIHYLKDGDKITVYKKIGN